MADLFALEWDLAPLPGDQQVLDAEPGGHRGDVQAHKEDSTPAITPDHSFVGVTFFDVFGPFFCACFA